MMEQFDRRMKSGHDLYALFDRTSWSKVKAGDHVWIDEFEQGRKPLANPPISGPYVVKDAQRRLLQTMTHRRPRMFMHYPDNLLVEKPEQNHGPDTVRQRNADVS